MIIKYPKTYHLPPSPGVNNDDKIINSIDSFLGSEIIITEKLDGGNTCVFRNNVYSRSVNSIATHQSYSYFKNNYLSLFYNIKDNIVVYGEYLYAIHSIEYNKLSSYFYIFAVKENDTWLSWNDVENISNQIGLPTVPVLYKGCISNNKEFNNKINELSLEPSLFNDEKEGMVIRVSRPFNDNQFQSHVAKYVRKNHVQTDVHWSKNWKPNKIRNQ